MQESGSISLAIESLRRKYVARVLKRSEAEWPKEQEAVEEKWRAIQAALVNTAVEVLGKEKKRQPDWFQDSKDHLRPYLHAWNSMYRNWLFSNKRQDLVKFMEARGKAKRELYRAKDEWFRKTAQEAEMERYEVSKSGRASRICSTAGEEGYQQGWLP